MDALRLPPPDADVTKLSGGERRRVALCQMLLETPRPAAARRADQPPRRRERRLARALPAGVPGHHRRGHPRSLLPRQRRGLDPRARSRRRHPLGGELLLLARAEEEAARGRGEGGVGAAADARRASSSGCAPRRAPARPSRRPASRRTRSCWRRSSRSARRRVEISIPPGPRLGDLVVKAEHLRKGYGDRVLIEDLTFNLPRGGIVGIIGAERRGQDDAVPDDHRAGEARRRHAPHRRHREAGLRRPEPRLARRRQDRVRRDRAGGRVPRDRQAQDPGPRLRRRASTSRAPTSRSG